MSGLLSNLLRGGRSATPRDGGGGKRCDGAARRKRTRCRKDGLVSVVRAPA
jgi:hypothetical protein